VCLNALGWYLGSRVVSAPPAAGVSVGAQPIVFTGSAQSARYLGLMFDYAGAASTMAHHRAACMASAFHATTSQLRAAPDFPCALPPFLTVLHTVIEPAGLYGCELWGLLSIPGLWAPSWNIERFYSLADVLEVHRCRLVRQWLRLPASVPLLPLLHELGCEPLVHAYVRRAVRFYNALLGLNVGSVFRGVLRQNVADAFGTPRAAQNFVGALFRVLRVLLPTERGLVGLLRAGHELDASAVDAALSRAYMEHLHTLSQVVSGSGSRIGLYFRVVGTHALGMVPPYYSGRHSHVVLVRFLRFRLGCHHLRVHTGRWASPVIPRTQRFCQRCTDSQLGLVDDEAHCLLRCTHPTLVQHRAHLFGPIPWVLCPPMLLFGHWLSQADCQCMLWSSILPSAFVCAGVAILLAVVSPCPPPPVLQVTDSLDLFDSESDFSADLASGVE
jgi:hypothetical protein